MTETKPKHFTREHQVKAGKARAAQRRRQRAEDEAAKIPPADRLPKELKEWHAIGESVDKDVLPMVFLGVLVKQVFDGTVNESQRAMALIREWYGEGEADKTLFTEIIDALTSGEASRLTVVRTGHRDGDDDRDRDGDQGGGEGGAGAGVEGS